MTRKKQTTQKGLANMLRSMREMRSKRGKMYEKHVMNLYAYYRREMMRLNLMPQDVNYKWTQAATSGEKKFKAAMREVVKKCPV